MTERVTEWAWAQTGLAANVRLALLAFAREADDRGAFTLRRKELATLLECSVDTVDRRVKALEAAKLLTVDRTPHKGGYKASRYTLACGRKTAATVVNIADAGRRNSAASPDRKVAASGQRRTAASLAATAAASIKEPTELVQETLELEDNPERVQLAEAAVARAAPPHILNGSAKNMRAHELASKLIEVIDSPSLSAQSHKLAATCGEIRLWIERGADFDADIVPTVAELCARKGGKPILSWKYFSAAVDDAALTRIALEQRSANPITVQEALAHDHASRTSEPTPIQRRERLSKASIERRQREAEREAQRQPIDYGRVVAVTIE